MAAPNAARTGHVVAVVGPTGTGKSDYALLLAGALQNRGIAAEVVNADAMQFYRGMDIGTAKLSLQERATVPHHLFDILEPVEEASVADYQRRARETIGAIFDRGAVPIMVGGSGLYLQATLDDFRFPGTDLAVRQALEDEFEGSGPGPLWERLRALDATAAERIGPHNGRRIVRALEVIQITGEPFSAMLPAVPTPWWPTTRIGFRDEPAVLAERLDRRVERMWRDGLLDEVHALLQRGLREGKTASRAIGYAQAAAELDGLLSRAEAIVQTQSLTRRYARRQRSWFGRDDRIQWLDGADPASRSEVPAPLLDGILASRRG